MVDAETERWVAHYVRQVESDPVIAVRRRTYSCRFGLDMQAIAFTIHMHQGRVELIEADPGRFGARREFDVRASANTWLQIAQPVPAPTFQGIFAAMAAHDLVVSGDMLPLFQHLTCFTRQIEVLRLTGVPDVVRQLASAGSGSARERA